MLDDNDMEEEILHNYSDHNDQSDTMSSTILAFARERISQNEESSITTF